MRRVSKQSGGLFARRMGLSPSRLGVNSTARMSDVAVSMARWTLRRSPLSLGPMARHGSPSSLNTMLPGLPLAIAEELDALRHWARTNGASMAQCPPAGSAARRHGDTGSGPSGSSASDTAWSSLERASPAPRAAADWRPSGGLPERQLEQHLDRQAELNRRIRENQRASRPAFMRRVPGHLFVQPD